MSGDTLVSPRTLRGTFSFYLSAGNTATLMACGSLADAVTVSGPTGPARVKTLRERGWDGTAIFDLAGYERNRPEIEPRRWFDEQSAALPDRVLTKGSWVPWDPTGDELKRAIEVEVRQLGIGGPGATIVLAVDHRWVAKAPRELADALSDVGEPVALVMAHASDPLGMANAIHGLIYLCRSVGHLSLLRTDHGGFGALAYGAGHAAVGLRSTHRHFVPKGMVRAGKNGDRTPRLFVRELLDWFTASTIAGWGVSSVDLRCPLTCCRQERMDRFLDPQYAADAITHNMMTLAGLADEILNAPKYERLELYRHMCSIALDRYGPMGKLSMVTKPKSQLLQWAFA